MTILFSDHKQIFDSNKHVNEQNGNRVDINTYHVLHNLTWITGNL